MLLIDDQDLVREGLTALIQAEEDLAVVGHARSAADAARLGVSPHVVVTEVETPTPLGTDAVIADVKRSFPRSGILALTNASHPARVQAALAGGADGYLLKRATSDDLLVGIRVVANGGTYLQPALGVEIARRHSRVNSRELSPREEQVLSLVATGCTNVEIADRMGVSLRTVESHRAHMQQKLGCTTRAELFECAFRSGLIW